MSTRATLGLLASATMIATISAPALATSEPETDEPISVDIIEGIDWSLTRQAIEGVLAELPEGLTITLRLDDGTATGNGGCNDYFASYERDGDAFTFGAIGATEMYCLDTSEAEASYFATLASVTAAFSTGGSLVMTGADGQPILEYLPADVAPMPTDAIEGLAWQLEWLADTGGADGSDVPAEVVVTMVLDGGVASGDGGCNRWSADYELDGSDLVFGPVMSTRKACPEPAMGVETAFFGQLGSVTSWASDGAGLVLFDAEGMEVARLATSEQG